MNLFFLSMSYVIQNFYKPTISTTFHHRFQLILHSNNIFTLFIFFKLYLLHNNTPKLISFFTGLWKVFFAGLFLKRLVFFETLFNIHSRLHLTTKFHRTVHLNALTCLLSLLKGKAPTRFVPVVLGKSRLTSTYLYPVKVVFTQLIKKLYKPIFILFMLLAPFQWPAISEKYSFSNTFFFVSRSFRLLYFENIKIFRTQYL